MCTIMLYLIQQFFETEEVLFDRVENIFNFGSTIRQTLLVENRTNQKKGVEDAQAKC